MDGEMGRRLRAERERQGLSLRSVAAEVGVSPSMLSQVETGRTQPSVSTLYALVSRLGVSIDALLGRNAGHGPLGEPVLRAGTGPRVEMDNGVIWDRLAVDGSGSVDPLLTTYTPGGSSSPEGRMMRHSGIEYGFVISGGLTLRLDEETILLGPGDSMCFDSMRPHLYLNHTDRPTRGVWFVVGGNSDHSRS